MANIYANPPAADTEYQSEPGWRPPKKTETSHPWMVAFLLAVSVAVISSLMLWHTHATRDRSAPPQPARITP